MKCRLCGVPVATAPTGRPRRYCSNVCRVAAYRKRRRANHLLLADRRVEHAPGSVRPARYGVRLRPGPGRHSGERQVRPLLHPRPRRLDPDLDGARVRESTIWPTVGQVDGEGLGGVADHGHATPTIGAPRREAPCNRVGYAGGTSNTSSRGRTEAPSLTAVEVRRYGRNIRSPGPIPTGGRYG
jgi:hypothetical protein